MAKQQIQKLATISCRGANWNFVSRFRWADHAADILAVANVDKILDVVPDTGMGYLTGYRKSDRRRNWTLRIASFKT